MQTVTTDAINSRNKSKNCQVQTNYQENSRKTKGEENALQS